MARTDARPTTPTLAERVARSRAACGLGPQIADGPEALRLARLLETHEPLEQAAGA